MKNQSLYNIQSTHLVTDYGGEQLSVEYNVFHSYPVIDATLNGTTRPTKVRAFRLEISLSKVDGGTSVPLLNVDFGDITPISGEMSYLVNSLGRSRDLNLDGLMAIINGVRSSQQSVFKEAAVKQLKKDIGFHTVDPARRQILADQGFLLVREDGRLCTSLPK